MPEAEWGASMLYELPAAELDELKSAIAASPIVSGPSWLEMRLSDWQNTRLSADVDTVILEWLVSHRPTRETALS
jgi:hypothetical protein